MAQQWHFLLCFLFSFLQLFLRGSQEGLDFFPRQQPPARLCQTTEAEGPNLNAKEVPHLEAHLGARSSDLVLPPFPQPELEPIALVLIIGKVSIVGGGSESRFHTHGQQPHPVQPQVAPIESPDLRLCRPRLASDEVLLPDVLGADHVSCQHAILRHEQKPTRVLVQSPHHCHVPGLRHHAREKKLTITLANASLPLLEGGGLLEVLFLEERPCGHLLEPPVRLC
mmetsp:Transcript_2845/g.7463  ORF Transcript_2845/g.7463 Transcript_2845/m.7463 type:complete len:225 (-) Transcript_2845:71-745(-)